MRQAEPPIPFPSQFPSLNPAPCRPQVAWQSLSEPGGGYHTRNAPPPAAACAAALLTTERCLLVDPRLRVIAAASIAPDLGLPVSCLWVGPALLVSTSCNQVRSSCDMPAALAVLCCALCPVLCCVSPAILPFGASKACMHKARQQPSSQHKMRLPAAWVAEC